MQNSPFVLLQKKKTFKSFALWQRARRDMKCSITVRTFTISPEQDCIFVQES